MARMKRISRSDLMDEFLESQGLHRKHIARDASCLFRAVSDQVYCTQATHSQVRKATVNYIRKHRQDYEQQIDEDFLEYLNKLNELKVLLCCSYDQHYDSVYPRSYLADAAFCQAIVYEVLYKRVFRMGNEANKAVEKMLHDKNYIRQRRSHLSSSLRLPDHIDMNGNPEEEVREAIEQGIPPFPFKVAKALDPNIYRNVEFDVWNEIRKDLLFGGEYFYFLDLATSFIFISDQVRAEMNGTTDFQPGDKCLVVVDKEKDSWHIGHIQEMNPNKGPVTVFVEELGEKSQTHLTFKPLGRYQRNFSVHPTCFNSRSRAKTSLQSNDSDCSKEESFEASNEAVMNESSNDVEVSYSGYCQTQYCNNDPCIMRPPTCRTSQHDEAEVSMETFCDKPPGVMDPDYCESATGGSPPYYVGTAIDPATQYSSPIISHTMPFIVTNSMQEPAYAINHNACRSNDINGNDLPMSDINTLRFFYNLGLDYYRISVQNQQAYPLCGYTQPVPVYPATHDPTMHPTGNYACAQTSANSQLPAGTYMYGHPASVTAPPQTHPTTMYMYPAPTTANFEGPEKVENSEKNLFQGQLYPVVLNFNNYNVSFQKLGIHKVQMKPVSSCYTAVRGKSISLSKAFFQPRPIPTVNVK
ncbi:putative bifunctional UDP-N-acetylglucosamine transferase and deubiquitinase ALG13 [Nymphon striatum]|nr:putative bifunctional UDP-N-acetylglucosamine transferase and deubiquitinase ALG13 [Nymphon striatum]